MNKHGHSMAQYIKAMAKIQGQVVMPDVKMPRKKFIRAKETAPRKQEEAEFRREVIKLLRRKGFRVWRIENGVSGGLGNGLPDLLIFSTSKMVFIELKSSSGIMYIKEQIEFMECCNAAGVKHLVLRPGEDVLERIKNA